MTPLNQAWNLESFVDALVVELDKTRDTLSVKAINKPLSYTVKDMAMDLQIFPTYDGSQVKFVTAQPGEVGSSKITIQLSSITDRQVRETSKRPASKDDIKIDEIDDIDDEVKGELRKIGVTSVRDLDRIESKDVDLESVNQKINYSKLASAIRGKRRGKRPPRVHSATLSKDQQGDYQMEIAGEHLSVDRSFEPVAAINGELVRTLARADNKVTFSFSDGLIGPGDNELVLVLDPYSVVKVNVQQGEPGDT